MDKHHRDDHHKRHHRRRCRSVSIPRGFLGHAVLQAVLMKPMSGTELMDEIEEKTNWRPGPGSMYPLLRRLSKEGSIEETELVEPGLKRFTITKKGKELFTEQKQENHFREKFYSFRRIWLRIFKEMDEELYDVNLQLFEAIEAISTMSKDKPSAATKVREILENTIIEIENIGNLNNDAEVG